MFIHVNHKISMDKKMLSISFAMAWSICTSIKHGKEMYKFLSN